jgi:CheY-like chemotaxis protein
LLKKNPLTKVPFRGNSMARILLVDDEEHIRQYYSEELADEGHKVWATDTGHELLGDRYGT